MKSVFQLEYLPPSANHMWRATRRFGKVHVYRSQAYMTWKNSVGWSLNRQAANQRRFDGPVFVTAALRRPRKNADCDNYTKCLGDLLQAHRIIENDKQIMGWNVYWSETLPEGIAVELVVRAADEVRAAA